MSFSNNTDSKVIRWLRFPLACLIVLLHSQILEPVYRPIVAGSGFAYALKIVLSEGVCRIAVPAFFLISGYLFFVNLEQWDKEVWTGKMKRRVHTLLIPYLIWNLVGIAYTCISPSVGAITEDPGSFMSIFQERGWLRLFWDSNRIMEQWNPPTVNILGVTMHSGMPANTPLWFIRDLIVINLLSPAIYAFVKYTREYGVCLLGILFLLNIGIPVEGFSIIGIFFYSVGAYFAIFSKGIVESFKKVKYISYALALGMLCALLATFGRSVFAQYVLRVFQIVGVISAFNIAASMVKDGNGRVSKLADSSFFLYASHIFIISAITFILSKVIPGTSQLLLAAKYLLAPAITIAICEGVYQIMKKVCPGILSFICGNRKVQTN